MVLFFEIDEFFFFNLVFRLIYISNFKFMVFIYIFVRILDLRLKNPCEMDQKFKIEIKNK